ncbi:MAG: signal peptidase I [Acidobacteriota bacterium]
MKKNPRRAWIAAALTLLLPGLGQLYAGEGRKGVSLSLGFVALFAGMLLLKVPRSFLGLVVFVLAILAYLVWTAWDAARIARYRPIFTLRPYNRWYLYLALTVAGGLVASQIVRFSPIRTFRLVSANMESTIHEGDLFFADLTYYRGAAPGRGDVVLFERAGRPGNWSVARVIGLPGEEIQVRDKRVLLDGRPFPDRWAHHTDPAIHPVNALFPGPLRQRDQYPARIVPAGTVFLLGDSRDNSYDSRFLGPVPLSALRGRVLYVYWSADGAGIGRPLR